MDMDGHIYRMKRAMVLVMTYGFVAVCQREIAIDVVEHVQMIPYACDTKDTAENGFGYFLFCYVQKLYNKQCIFYPMCVCVCVCVCVW